MPAKTKCFNCGAPTGTSIQNTRPPEHRKWICTAEKCWKKWHEKFKH